MIATIYHNGGSKQITIHNSISLIERIDKVLDGGNFDFYDTSAYNYPPFSIIEINNKCYFFSTTCSHQVTTNRVLHTATIIEGTKLLQTLLVGSKGFRNNGDEEYDTNYGRIKTLVDLMRIKYNKNNYIDGTKVYLSLDTSLKNVLNKKRDYNFGSGTTLYDAIFEIMSTQGYLLKCELENVPIYNDDETEVISNEFRLNIKGLRIAQFETNASLNTRNIIHPQTLNFSQNVDEYCSNIEIEMPSVVDEGQYQMWYGTPRYDGVLSNDNVELHINKPIYDVKYMYIYTEQGCSLSNVFSFKRDYSVFPLNGASNQYGTYEAFFGKNDKLGYFMFITTNISRSGKYNSKQIIPTQILTSWDAFYTNNNLSNTNVVLQMYITENYVHLSPYKETRGYHYVCFNPLIESTLFETLEDREKQFFLSYSHNGDTITNLKDEYSSFWDGQIVSNDILSAIATISHDSSINKGDYFFCDIIDNSFSGTSHYTSNGVEYWMTRNYPTPSFNGFQMDELSLTDRQFGLKYITSSPIFNRISKGTTPLNESKWKGITRSYSNGGNNIDLDALGKDMKREVDYLGQITCSFESYENYSLGAKLTYNSRDLGFVIFKETIIHPNNLRKYKYNTSIDINYIAEAIGVATQYEATKVVLNNVVDRYIYIEKKASSLVSSTLLNAMRDGKIVYLSIEGQEEINVDWGNGNNLFNGISMDTTIYEDDVTHEVFVIASTLSNFLVGMRQGQNVLGENTGLNNSSYRAIIPISITNNRNGYQKEFTLRLMYKNRANMGLGEYNMFPLTINSTYTTIMNETLDIRKDASERLIFVIKIKPNNS